MKTIDDVKLIEQVQRFPQIYDRSDKDFKFRKNKTNAFSAVAQILDSETTTVQSRWIVLRNRFATELRNVKKSGPSGVGSARTWKFFESLKFLEPHIQSRKKKEPSSSSETSESETTSTQFALSEIEIDDNREKLPETSKIITVNEEKSSQEPREHPEMENAEAPTVSSLREEVETLELGNDGENDGSTREGSSRSLKRKKRGDESEVGVALLTTLMKFSKCVNRQESPTQDEDELFGKLVGQYLKKVTDTRDKLELKRQILSAFLHARSI